MKKNPAPAKVDTKNTKTSPKKTEKTKVVAVKKKEVTKQVQKKEEVKKVTKEPTKAEAPKMEMPKEPEKPREIAVQDVAKLLKTPPTTKWYTILDKTGTLFTFFKYQGNMIMTYSADDITPIKLKHGCHAVIKGRITTFDFKGDATEIISDLIAKGGLIKEMANPATFNTEAVYNSLKEADDDGFFMKNQGMFIFLCTEQKSISKWMKENTELLIVNP